MAFLSNKLQREYKIEYVGKPFKSVSIYPKAIATKKLSEFSESEKKHLTRKGFRWYLYYSFWNPDLSKFVKQPPIYAAINQNYPGFDERYQAIRTYQKALVLELEAGYNPYDEKEASPMTSTAIEKAKQYRQTTMNENTFVDFCIKVAALERYLSKKRLLSMPITEVKKSHITDLLTQKAKETSAATRNSYKASISSLFSALVELDYIPHNFVKDIPNIKTRPKAHKVFTSTQRKEIFTTLKETRPDLLFFIQFFTYSVIRPIEAMRIQVKDINADFFYLNEGKAELGRQKSIPKILAGLIPDLSGSNPDFYLFGRDGYPGLWPVSDVRRREVYTKRFNRYVKKPFNLSREYTMYGFRHTLISEVFNKILAETGNFETALQETQKITEHRSRQALMKYLRSINAVKREDYSKYL